ncbi:MAG: mevalonate kinase [archaeon]|jgi:mevalonate kinase|nr:mevalonate kinase [Euryarchaeota archaeon]MDP6704102.1 mevalonate kinase [archaeon]MDP7260407.1 mevalonate kinase [archaeon]HIK01011.1 mevalonate kinase [Candidatus Undinarchaeales archaeon ERR594346 U_76725]|tara:strand:+ start:66150 stop:67073 length:924 start_codon:yes stop_codon:yes gene_type:complete
MIRASAPGKLILFGDHAVVYGEPGIATAINKRAYSTACELDGKKIVVESKDTGETTECGIREKSKNPIIAAVQEAQKFSKSRSGIGIEINSQIPIGAGLGSSAAVATATIASVATLLTGKEPSTMEIAEMAYKADKLAHESPSGIDTAVTSLGGTIFFKKGNISQLDSEPLTLVVANSGVRRNTSDMVLRVKNSIRDPRVALSMFSIGSLSKEARTILLGKRQGDLGPLMDRGQSLLKDLGVSSTSLEDLVQLAKDSGAVGSKITGAGGGGCIISLSDNPETLIQAFKESGASAYSVRTNQPGVRID